ncbi:MAG: hypothetical protein Q8O55_07560 [Dehalococcoidales bacterium]|nr:hypothetical protein [Dehalococcoidales bacterium]
MASKAGVILGLAAATGVIFLAGKAIRNQSSGMLTENAVLASADLLDLDANYVTMNHLLITGQVDRPTYDRLYAAYVTRFYQLVGG